MSVLINASTSSGLVQTADTSGTLELQSNGTTQLTVSSTGAYGQLKSGTAVASTSGTSIDFTGLPSWVKRITVSLSAVSLNSTSVPMLQLGDSGGVETTGYNGSTNYTTASAAATAVISNGAGFYTNAGAAAYSFHGTFTLTLLDAGTNTWACAASLSSSSTAIVLNIAGSKALSATLDRVRLTSVSGTDTFDAGSINILYEG